MNENGQQGQKTPGLAVSTFWYKQGQWLHWKFGEENQGEDPDDALHRMGYHPSQTVGDDNGLSYELWEHCPDATWVVICQTAGLYCLILVTAWPDLISLLRDLSVIALAGLTDAEGFGAAHIPVRQIRGSP